MVSAILLGASMIPKVSAQTVPKVTIVEKFTVQGNSLDEMDEASAQTPGARTIVEKFTVQGNSLDEIQEQVSQHVNEMGLTNEQEEEVVDVLMDDVQDQLPDPDETSAFFTILFIIIFIVIVGVCILDAIFKFERVECTGGG
jgi:hypothetical protein